MKTITLIATFSVFAVAVMAKPSPLEELRRQPAISYIEKRDPDNQYELKYETAEGIIVEESGVLREGANHTVYLYKSGKSTWTDENGVTFVTTWSSDENGYHAQGPHIPVNTVPSTTFRPEIATQIPQILGKIRSFH